MQNMALQHCVYAAQLPRDRKEGTLGTSQSDYISRQAPVFGRRLLVNVGSASLVALGANFVGITSSLLGIFPETSRNLKLDVLYPIGGYTRCLDTNESFEFIYPASWVRDQTLFYRAIGKAESERSLDPPPLNQKKTQRHNFSEPVVALGPPGSNGELNISVIVSPVSPDFSIEAFGGPKEVGEAVIKTITGRRSDVKAMLIKSKIREDRNRNMNYYELEFGVESPSFRRHNVAICCTLDGRLYTLNAQAPESAWTTVKQDFYKIADSFTLTV
ncbi:hypothetical protein GIB67_015168 [Kingdonia uniflora]|uniref:PsbP C-terminal domain-containing protein n=1 Tax=Kingdonia uniflora TaxID=39325 RepID=A0A7J7LJG5_9MAGN|nr:hypothetical protein GIB67_015168 [Kingdonia uniflora]